MNFVSSQIPSSTQKENRRNVCTRFGQTSSDRPAFLNLASGSPSKDRISGEMTPKRMPSSSPYRSNLQRFIFWSQFGVDCGEPVWKDTNDPAAHKDAISDWAGLGERLNREFGTDHSEAPDLHPRANPRSDTLEPNQCLRCEIRCHSRVGGNLGFAGFFYAFSFSRRSLVVLADCSGHPWCWGWGAHY